VRLAARDKPLKGNPGRGSGMKQARKTGSGANRRGRAKRRGRNVRQRRGSLCQQWTPPVVVAKRRSSTPRKALASGAQRIARSEVQSSQRADGGAQSSEEDDNARGSPNPLRKWRGMATGKVRRTRQIRAPAGLGTTHTVPITGRRTSSEEHRTSRETDAAERSAAHQAPPRRNLRRGTPRTG